MDFKMFKTIPEAILEYKDSQKTAVCCGEEALSYHELIRDSRRFALALKKEGIGKGSYVMLCMTRSTRLMTALLGILYAGAAYVAVDPEWPKSRLDFIKQDCGNALVLDDELFYAMTGRQDADADWSEGELPRLDASDEMSVYYTSGSTGAPKGAVSHHGVYYNFLIPLPQNIVAYETKLSCDVVFSMLNFAFAGSNVDIFCALLNGMTLVLATKREQQSPSLLGACMKKHRVEALHTTPSTLLRYFEDSRFEEGMSHLKRITLSGEPLSSGVVARARAATQAVIINLYGTSEVQACAFARVVSGEKSDLGTPAYGVRLYVLDEDGKLHETGETGQRAEGELCIGGMPAQYSYYIGREELSAQKFTLTEGHGRIYHTGDMALLQEDGRIYLGGRADGLMKLHGQRLEPGEVAAAMEAYPGIDQAVADVRGDGPDAKLFAWYVPSSDSGDKHQGGVSNVEECALRTWLLDRLPAYMVPVRFMAVSDFPLNGNGKLDRSALPDIPVAKTPASPPENELERLLCDAFARVLPPGTNTGRDTGFFEAGGDSIRAMSLIGFLDDHAGYSLGMRELMKNPTPALLAKLLKKKGHTVSEKHDLNEAAAYPFRLPEDMRSVRDDPKTEAVLPVNNVTLGYLYLKQHGMMDAGNVTRAQIRVPRSLSETEFKDRFLRLMENHPALRSHFMRDQSGTYWQVIRTDSKVPVYYKDISSMSEKESDYFISGFWQIMDRAGGLFSAACLALGGEQCVVLVRADHTICDGVSVNIIVSELTDPGYRQYTEDPFLAHRLRTLASYMTPTSAIREYYENAVYRLKSMELLQGSHKKRESRKVILSAEKYEQVSSYLEKRGITFYSYVQYAYGRAWLEVLSADEIWLLTMESGRYPGWKDDLRIVGNIIIAVPVKVTSDMTPEAFQENLFLLRSGPYLSDNREIPGGQWIGIYEGITSNEFSGSGEKGRGFELVDYNPRTGNSMWFEGGDLVIELRYPGIDEERERYRKAAEKLGEILWSAKEL